MIDTQNKADKAYADGHDAFAYRLYERLARAGDKFSAFRIATMHEDGRHVEQSLIEAYAWSYLAAETGRKDYRTYHEGIRERLSNDQLQQARKRAGELIGEYGAYTFAVETRKTLRGMLQDCVGSRLGSRCDRVAVSWGGCGIGADRLAEVNCLRIGSIGLEGYNTAPLTIRQAERALDHFIEQYQPGRVELGDFELIEEAAGNENEPVHADDG